MWEFLAERQIWLGLVGFSVSLRVRVTCIRWSLRQVAYAERLAENANRFLRRSFELASSCDVRTLGAVVI